MARLAERIQSEASILPACAQRDGAAIRATRGHCCAPKFSRSRTYRPTAWAVFRSAAARISLDRPMEPSR